MEQSAGVAGSRLNWARKNYTKGLGQHYYPAIEFSLPAATLWEVAVLFTQR